MLHDILVSFKGSQDGRSTELFEAGTARELSETLAVVVVREGWARPAGAPALIANKAVVSDGAGGAGGTPVQNKAVASDGAGGAASDKPSGSSLFRRGKPR